MNVILSPLLIGSIIYKPNIHRPIRQTNVLQKLYMNYAENMIKNVNKLDYFLFNRL